MQSLNKLQDYFKASSGRMSEEEFYLNHDISTADFEEAFREEHNVDVSGAERLSDTKATEEGKTSMDEQMSMFNKGGLATDPVSGNEIPIGSTAKEVRDDIDAKVSEGEYILPANVVRFFGVDYIEKLVAKAEKGLTEMDAKGRIGGEKDNQEFNDGGLTGTFDPNQWKTLGNNLTANPLQAQQQVAQSYEYRPYTNAAGVTQMILFMNGEPTQAIPEGFVEGTSAPVQKSRSTSEKSTPEPQPTIKPTSPLTQLDFANPDSITNWASENLGANQVNIPSLSVGTTLVGKGINLATQARGIAEVRAASMIAAEQGNVELASRLSADADKAESESGILSKVPDSWLDGDRIYDRYLKSKEDRPEGSSPQQTETDKVFKEKQKKDRQLASKPVEEKTKSVVNNIVAASQNTYSKGGLVSRRKPK